jgi:hypothetical protein
MQALFGFSAGLVVCALIWIDGERAERRERIERARRRDHRTVPSIHPGDWVRLESPADGVVIHVDAKDFSEWEAKCAG